MTKPEENTKILPISNNALILESIGATFKEEHTFELIDRSVLSQGVLPAVAEIKPDLILLDFEYRKEETYELVDKIATQYPTVAVVVILPETKVQFSDKVILAGARAFILYPFTQKNLLVTTRRVLELLNRNFPTLTPQDLGVALPTKPKNTFVVFSPKGGSGCSTVAVSLAIALRQTLKEPLILVDGKHLFGHVALMLNLRTANSITDLISHAGMLDQHLISQVVVDHVSGIKVLPSPAAISEGQGIRPDDLYKVILGVQTAFPVTVVDGGNTLNDNVVTYMDAADRVIVVMNPDLASIRDVRQFIEVARSLSYPPEKIILVLNDVGHKADIRKEEIENILKFKIAITIPSDDNLIISCINEGIPVILKNSHHPISRAIQDLANLIAKVISNAAAAYATAEKKTNAEVLAKTSRLG